MGNQMDLAVEIRPVENPRKEPEEHYYNPTHTGLLELGLEPHFLIDEVLGQLLETVLRYKSHIQEHKFYRKIKWA